MPTETAKPSITPDTKVGELLRHFPALEDVLIDISPTYRALKNPVLRKTVAKIANLRQVAKVGNVPLATLIGKLRAGAGQAPSTDLAEAGATPAARPSWAEPRAVHASFDARALIEAGGHPLEQVMRDLDALAAEQVYALVTGFQPEPLIDLARHKGFEAFSVWDGADVVCTYFRRR
ncbi:MAG: DUF1858 domain-containing protein [Deltaproteobacteria bacterium]|nr:DUF1858 domain-containing protein [Deltaproteobacteria bacterium]